MRVARLAEDGRRVAACSYTNVGVEQIRRVLLRDLRRPLDARHFVGTLHGWLLRYVLYPFGHLATSSPDTPRLLADDGGWRDVTFGGDNRIRLPLSRFRFRPDGSLCVRSVPPRFPYEPDDAAAKGQADALRMKFAAARAGIVSFDDAMYWALRVLEENDVIAEAVASRFDELLVDEAQDTSELQLACLRTICETGKLQSLVLVGDLEQSISAYTGASRVGCEALASERELERIDFTENHRSSQRICDVAVHFCSREKPDRAVGEDADCPWQPELILYPAERPDRAVELFQDRLEQLGEAARDAAVLARSNALVDELNGQRTRVDVRARPLTVGRAVSALRGAGTLGRRDLEAVDRVIAYTAVDVTDLTRLEPDSRWEIRQATMDLLRSAPDLHQDLRSWIRGSAKALGDIAARLVEKPAHKAGQVLASAATHSEHVAADVLVPPGRLLRAQTVHDIKGESRGAVLVVVDRLRSRRRAAQSALWSRPLVGETVDEKDAEELRIAFVALTRARRYCALALPDDCGDDVLAAYENVGFELASAR